MKRITARTIAAQILNNVASFDARAITVHEFTRRQFAIWAQVDNRPRASLRVKALLCACPTATVIALPATRRRSNYRA